MTSPFCRDDPLTTKLHSPVERRTAAAIAVRRKYTVDVRFKAARVRLFNLVSSGSLTSASAVAYAAGIGQLAWSRTPLGQLPPVRAVEVHVLEPVVALGAVVVPVRWETRGRSRLQVLDADLSLMPATQDATVLVLTGTFRLPASLAGAQTVAATEPHAAAVACADTLLGHVAEALTGPVVPARA
jgi:hypothetical protein